MSCVEVLRFQQHDAAGTPPVRARGRFYGDYPFRGDRGLRIPRATYRLGRRDEDLALTAHLEDIRSDGGKLRIRGHAYINGLGCATGAGQRTTIGAVRNGRLRTLRMRVSGLRIPTAPTRRADLGGDYAWAGFEAALDPGALSDGTWSLFAATRIGLLRRRRARFLLASPQLIGAVDLDGGDGVLKRVLVTSDGAIRVEVRRAFARLGARRVSGGVLELSGELRRGHEPRLELRRRSDGRAHAYDVAPRPRRLPGSRPARRPGRRAAVARGRRDRRPGRPRDVGRDRRRPPAGAARGARRHRMGARARTRSRSRARARATPRSSRARS